MHSYYLYQGLRNFFCQIVNISAFAGYLVFVATTQLCQYSTEAAFNNSWTNGRGYVPIKLYIQKQEMGLDLSCRPEFANPWFLRLDVKARVNRMDTGKGRQMWRGGEQGRLEPMTWDVCHSLIAFKSLASEMHKSCRRSGTFYFCAKPTCDPGIGRNDRRFLGTRVAAGLAAAPWPWGKSANKLQLCLVLLSWLTFWVQNAYGFCFCSAIQNSCKMIRT